MSSPFATAVPLPLVEMWPDGSCRPNPGDGSCAVILRNAKGEVAGASAFHRATTNNQMELRAAILGFSVLKQSRRVRVYLDSEYVQLGMTTWMAKWIENGWRSARKPVANKDLWLLLAAAAGPHEVEWIWVKGHGEDVMNNRVDALAFTAREQRRGTGLTRLS